MNGPFIPANAPEIALIAALPIEYSAIGRLFGRPDAVVMAGDRNLYRLVEAPSVSRQPHHVVLTQLAQDGTRSAAASVAELLRSFPSVRVLLMCGIAGGLPRFVDPADDVRLGDIVVATRGIVDYDHVYTVDGRDEPRRAVEGVSADAVRADRELQFLALSAADPHPWEADLIDPAAPFARPGPSTDALEPRRPPAAGRPSVHRGAIGSADRLLRDAALRDRLRDRHGILAVEMEGSGVAVAAALQGRQWFVVRGVADYCDNAKDDLWHPYAALSAAAYVRALLGAMPPFEPAGPGGSVPSRPTAVPSQRSGELPLPALDAIAEALLRIDEVRDDVDRRVMVRGLPRQLSVSIPGRDRPKMHVMEIVRACVAYQGGRRHLVEALRAVVPERSIALQEALRTIAALWPEHPGE